MNQLLFPKHAIFICSFLSHTSAPSSLISPEVEAERDQAQKETRTGSPRSLVKWEMRVTHNQQSVQAHRPLPEPSPNSGLKMISWSDCFFHVTCKDGVFGKPFCFPHS